MEYYLGSSQYYKEIGRKEGLEEGKLEGIEEGELKENQKNRNRVWEYFLSLGYSEKEAQKKVDLLIPKYDPIK